MNDILCGDFERWLDEGADAVEAERMHAHAAACARCAASLTAMAELDALLASPVPAPPGFTDATMARVARTPRLVLAAPVDDVPWWIAVLQQPAVVLAAIVAALWLWKADALVSTAGMGAAWLAGLSMSAMTQASGWFAAAAPPAAQASGAPASLPVLTMGVALGLAPVLAYASFALAGWVTRLIAGPHARS